MATYNKFFNFSQALGDGQVNLSADAVKVMLTNVLPNSAANAVYSDITEIAAQNGYVAGGNALTIASAFQSGGVYTMLPAGTGIVTFTAALTGSFGPFRYPVLYDATTLVLISWYDYGAPITLNPGDKFNIAFQIVSGVLQIS